jgi:hypothetical protein
MSWNSVNPFPNGVQTVTAGSNITVSGTVTNPVVSASGGGGGGVATLTAGSNITLTGTATNPIVSASGVASLTAGSNITLTGTATNPIISATSSGGTSMGYKNVSALVTTQNVTVVPNTIYNLTVWAIVNLQAAATTWTHLDTIIINQANFGGTVVFKGQTTTHNLPNVGQITMMYDSNNSNFAVGFEGSTTTYAN